MHLEFKTESEYLIARHQLNQYEAAAKKYMHENKTNGIPCEITKTFPYNDIVNNALRSAVEVWEFKNDPPTDYFLYVGTDAHTWTGQHLGNVSFGREYRSNFGDVRQPIDVYGINGIKYHGIFYKSTGDYARIKAYKKQAAKIN